MLDGGAAEQDAAYWLPQGAMTDIVVTGNFRAWYEYLPKRLMNIYLKDCVAVLCRNTENWQSLYTKSLPKLHLRFLTGAF